MDYKDENTVLDTTEVEQQDKLEAPTVQNDNNRLNYEALCQMIYEGTISSVNPIGIDSDVNNSKSEQVEDISRALIPPPVDMSEGNENQSQARSEEDCVATSSADGFVENIGESTKAGEKDQKCTDCNPTDTFKNILGLCPFELNTGDRIPPFNFEGNDEKRLVDLPGALKSVRSLKELSARKIPDLESIWRKSKNLSENDIHQQNSAAQNSYTYLSYKDKEQYAGSSKPSELEPGLSDIPLTEGEDKIVIPTEHREVEGSSEGSERKAFFYISSSSIPGMSDGWEWPSVSVGYHNHDESRYERPDKRFVRQESREPVSCLGTQRCHYIVIAIALLTTVLGCIVYHLSYSGIVPDVLRPVGSTTAFMSFGVCVFSTIYISYLKNYIQLIPMVPNYEMLGDVDSVMAMNRTSNPEFVYADGYDRAEESEFIRQTQSADVLDRRGYFRNHTGSQTEVKRYTEDLGTDYSSQPQKKFKTEYVVPDEIIQLSDLGCVSKPSSEETVQSCSEKKVSG